MPNLFNLQCPTCGASLQADGESRKILCEHCGNQYLLDQKLEQMNAAERAQLSPTVTYANKPGQWIRVAEYDVCLHTFSNQKVGKEQVLFIEVEYENKTADPLKYRHDQWIVFNKTGYTFEPVKDFFASASLQTRSYLCGYDARTQPRNAVTGLVCFRPAALACHRMFAIFGRRTRYQDFGISDLNTN